jgi:hypothetical protein
MVNSLPEPIKNDLPEPIMEMMNWLKEKGFLLIEQSYTYKAFGNYRSTWERQPHAFRLARDRLVWNVLFGIDRNIAAPNGVDPYLWAEHPIWEAYIEGLPMPINPSREILLSESITFFQDKFDEIVKLLKLDNQFEAHLRGIGIKTHKAIRANFHFRAND